MVFFAFFLYKNWHFLGGQVVRKNPFFCHSLPWILILNYFFQVKSRSADPNWGGGNYFFQLKSDPKGGGHYLGDYLGGYYLGGDSIRLMSGCRARSELGPALPSGHHGGQRDPVGGPAKQPHQQWLLRWPLRTGPGGLFSLWALIPSQQLHCSP